MLPLLLTQLGQLNSGSETRRTPQEKRSPHPATYSLPKTVPEWNESRNPGTLERLVARIAVEMPKKRCLFFDQSRCFGQNLSTGPIWPRGIWSFDLTAPKPDSSAMAKDADNGRSQASQTADIVIVGGGLVGASLGLALSSGGLSVVVIDAAEPADSVAPAFDGRASAVAFASCRMLQQLELWADLTPHAQPINDIVVSDGQVRNGAAPLFLHFDHTEIGDEPLGHMLENRHLRVALQKGMSAAENLTLLAPCFVDQVHYHRDGVEVRLADGTTVRAKLCVAADGRNSRTREAVGLKTISWSYDQCGIVATVQHAQPHQGVAHEYFLPSGPFAILPLMDNRSSLVWTEAADLTPAFLEMSDADFNHAMQDRFGSFLGDANVIGKRWSYPLGLQLAHDYVAPRLVLVGDAAHAIHPIAGQGFNMGLRDVAALSEVLIDAARLGLDIGATDVLQRYQTWRRFDNVLLAGITDVLNRLFSNDFAPLRLARGLGLAAVGQIGPLRRFFMSHAGGSVGDLPRLLRGEPL